MTHRPSKWLWLLLALVVPLLAPSTGRAAIAPPWCGTPVPDAAAALPSTGPRNFPHIPYYAIGCTLDRIAAESNGRMKVEVIGQSALGRDMYLVTINELETRAQREDYRNWQRIRRVALEDPERAQELLDRAGDDVKIPLFIQGGIHGDEFEGVDSNMLVIEKLATTPYGTDPEIDRILDHSVVLFNVIQNPDGRIAGTRDNGNGFDLNRDFLTQSQPETRASVSVWQKWLPPDHLDLHGYLTPWMLIEATTKPHNPGIDYDMWLKWNQSRIDANEAALNAAGYRVQRPINDWCADAGSDYPYEGGVCPDGTTPGPAVAEGWDDWGPFYTPMYGQLIGMNGSTVEVCRLDNDECDGRLGARVQAEVTTWSTLLFNVANRVEVLADQLELYERGVEDAPRPACCPPPFDVANNWMVDYPKAFVIPVGEGQRSDAEARRLVEWLLANGIVVHEVERDYRFGSQRFEEDSYVVWMGQAHRGLAYTSLDIGLDISDEINILYAAPGAWSHGYLWGADIVTIPDSAVFRPRTDEIRRPNRLDGGIASGRGDDDDKRRKRARAYALELDSPTAVRTLNALLRSGVSAELATVASAGLPAGTVLFPASARKRLDKAGEDAGVWFRSVQGPLPAREPIEGSPRFAVTPAPPRNFRSTEAVWALRNLGFSADLLSTAALNDAAGPDPLANYDVLFNVFNLPGDANAAYVARVTAFFARGGGYIGGGTGGANFLNSLGQTTGLAAASRGGNGRSGIISWDNHWPGTGLITGAYPNRDTAIVDPPTWFTGIPAGWTRDASLPLTGFFLSGLWRFDAQSASAPGSALITHGTNTAGTSRITAFAMNPLYRADPEREWPMLASAAYWVDN
jgi:hypothetical protein